MFRLRLGGGGLAKITAMKIRLDPSKTPAKVRLRKYPAEQRNFLDEYLSQFVELYFIKSCLQAAWQAAPHLVSKDSEAKFRMTIDLKPVNMATVAEQWAMTVIEAELRDFKNSRHFTSLDCSSGYWQ